MNRELTRISQRQLLLEEGEECERILQNIITLYMPKGLEDGPETGEEKVARLMQDEHHATKQAEQREVLIRELEWKVKQLSDQVQSLQEQNHGLQKCIVSLCTQLKNANDTIALLSSRAIYILRRYHQLYRSKVEQH